MSEDDEITLWLRQLSAGDPQGAERLWAAYFERLTAFAAQRVRTVPCPGGDGEDIALSAMHSFCRGLQQGRFDGLRDRHDLWRLLVTIAARKVYRERRRASAAKRGGDAVHLSPAEAEAILEQVVGREPTPELACMVAESCRALFARLDDETLRRIAQAKLEGYSHAEIAEQLGCSVRSVERRLELIRAIWSRSESDEE